MASDNSVVAEIQDSFLSCSICFQPYNRPKALPCLHTFCEGCLRDYVVSRGHQDTGHFPCPLCRQDIVVPGAGVVSFPDNHFIIGLSETVTTCGMKVETQETTPLLRGADAKFCHPDPSNKLIRRFGNWGSLPHEFLEPTGIAASAFTDDVFVVDSKQNKVCVFSSTGEFRRCFACECSVRDVAVTRRGTILVTVRQDGSSILREYAADGRFCGSFGKFYMHENPFGIALTSNDRVVITELGQHCVHVLTPKYRRSERFGSHGRGSNQFSTPYYVTTNSRDDIIVADCGNHRIKVHLANGTFVRQFGKEGSNPGQLMYPMGVCVDRHGNIYVADANNYRVQMFSPGGHFLGTPVKDTYEYGIDVKPINVLFIQENVLMVILRGPKFCQVHSYVWDTSKYTPVKEKSTVEKLLCCF